MQLQQLLADDDAVSPVIGVILMVAITVILAAVIGTFVLGLGDQVQTTAPNSNFAFDFDNDQENLTVTHNGGDGIEGQSLILTGDVHQSGDSWADVDGDIDDTDQIRAGDSIEVANVSASPGDRYNWTNSPPGEDVEVNVVWRDAEGERSSTLRSWSRD